MSKDINLRKKMTHGRKFYEPLADGAPKPKIDLSNELERVIHFFPPHLKKVTDKLDEIAKKADVKMLMLGHYSARYTDLKLLLDEAKLVFDNTVLADDGLKINL